MTYQDHKLRIHLDTRRASKDGRFPVQLRIYLPVVRREKRVAIKLRLTEKEYHDAWGSGKSVDNLHRGSREYEIYSQLKEILDDGYHEAEKMDNGDLNWWASRMKENLQIRKESKLGVRSGGRTNLQYQFNRKTKKFEKEGRVKASIDYNSACRSLIKYECYRRSINPIDYHLPLDMKSIDVDWLNGYEEYQLEVQGRSITTVGIYTRTLKVIFRSAMENGDLSENYYPFGRGRYEIPSENRVKKTLKRAEVIKLYRAEGLTSLEQEARDWWFFSYACQGMNFKDIALLRNKDVSADGTIGYYRKKTLKKKRRKTKIVISPNEKMLTVLNRYRVQGSEEDYVFPILSRGDSPKEIQRKVNNWIRKTNQQLKRLAKKLEFPEGFSTYWARHSWATNMMNLNAPVALISEGLNHSDISVTQHYLDGFEDEIKEEFNSKLLDL